MPAFVDVDGERPVEGRVNLDCVVTLGVERHPVLLGDPFGVEDAAPVLVVVSRRADQQLTHSQSLLVFLEFHSTLHDWG